MYSRQFSAFFFGRDIMKKLFRNVHKKITNLVDFFANASVESNNFTKITCGFFLVYLPNFLVGHLYILLNKKNVRKKLASACFQILVIIFCQTVTRGKPAFFDPFCVRFSETLAICSICCVREAVCSC